MSNEDMIANRFLRWHLVRKKYNAIVKHLEADGTVYVCTAYKATKFTRKHIAMFKATKKSLYMQRGKFWDCIDFCGIQFV